MQRFSWDHLHCQMSFSRAIRRRTPLRSSVNSDWSELIAGNGFNPIFGKVLLCDCPDYSCHTSVLRELVFLCGQCEAQEDLREHHVRHGIVGAADQRCGGGNQASHDSIQAMPESVSREPAWPKAWRSLVDTMRNFRSRVFWGASGGSGGGGNSATTEWYQM